MKQNGDTMIMLNDEETKAAVGGVAKGAEWKLKGRTYYRIARGDTLGEIASRFHTSGEAIKALNPILIKSLGELQEGWEIRVL